MARAIRGTWNGDDGGIQTSTDRKPNLVEGSLLDSERRKVEIDMMKEARRREAESKMASMRKVEEIHRKLYVHTVQTQLAQAVGQDKAGQRETPSDQDEDAPYSLSAARGYVRERTVNPVNLDPGPIAPESTGNHSIQADECSSQRRIESPHVGNREIQVEPVFQQFNSTSIASQNRFGIAQSDAKSKSMQGYDDPEKISVASELSETKFRAAPLAQSTSINTTTQEKISPEHGISKPVIQSRNASSFQNRDENFTHTPPENYQSSAFETTVISQNASEGGRVVVGGGGTLAGTGQGGGRGPGTNMTGNGPMSTSIQDPSGFPQSPVLSGGLTETDMSQLQQKIAAIMRRSDLSPQQRQQKIQDIRSGKEEMEIEVPLVKAEEQPEEFQVAPPAHEDVPRRPVDAFRAVFQPESGGIAAGTRLVLPSELKKGVVRRKAKKDWGECMLTFDKIKEPVSWLNLTNNGCQPCRDGACVGARKRRACLREMGD